MTASFDIATVDALPGQLGFCALPGRHNNLDQDLTTIAAWQPIAVVSLTETSEMTAQDCADLGPRLQKMGMEWHHLPIPDYGTPDRDIAQRWTDLAATLHGHLDQGRRVLVHCKGGLGRSGMIVLRLLIERGMEKDAALGSVRESRAGAVETDAQLDWAVESDTRRGG